MAEALSIKRLNYVVEIPLYARFSFTTPPQGLNALHGNSSPYRFCESIGAELLTSKEFRSDTASSALFIVGPQFRGAERRRIRTYKGLFAYPINGPMC